MATSHQIAINQAIDAVVRVESPMQFRQASRLFNVPKTSLIDYVWEFRKIQYDRTLGICFVFEEVRKTSTYRKAN